MIRLRPAAERGHFQNDWLDSRHSFSFDQYRDPEHVHFGPLRVINEDVVAPRQGFPMHAHRDMEIITYVLSGSLAHRDSLGTGSTIRPGEIQRMSAGTGIMHSEFNASETEPVHLMQIWIIPAHRGQAPSYEQKSFSAADGLTPIVVSRNGAAPAHAVSIDQDVTVYAGKLASGGTTGHVLKEGRSAWLQLAKGALDVNGTAMRAGDGAAVSDEKALQLKANEESEFLLFDLP
jgi:redox-sensitive bicupin YhaK (pirin superfamily)